MKKSIALALLVAFLTVSAKAQDDDMDDDMDEGRAESFGVAAGFTTNPGTFLMMGRFDFPISIRENDFTIGPVLQFGMEDEDALELFGATANLKYYIPLREVAPPWLRPSLEAGAGVLISGEDKSGSFLFMLGGGVDFAITRSIEIGAHVYANPAPGPGEDFYMSYLFGTNFILR